MQLIQVYKCLCDLQRLRILNLLREGPLCVCHLMEILEADQVRISKQLRYLKELGAVDGERRAQWMVYSLVDPVHPTLLENLHSLPERANEHPEFRQDLKLRAALIKRLQRKEIACKEAVLSGA